MAQVDSRDLLKRLAYHSAQFKRDLKGWMKSGRHTGQVTWGELRQEMAKRARCSPDTLENGKYRVLLKNWLLNWSGEIETTGTVEKRLEGMSKDQLCELVRDQQVKIEGLEGEVRQLRSRYSADRAEFETLLLENELQRKLMMAFKVRAKITSIQNSLVEVAGQEAEDCDELHSMGAEGWEVVRYAIDAKRWAAIYLQRPQK